MGRPSAFVGKFMEPMLSGIFTTGDAVLYDYMRDLMEAEGVFIDPPPAPPLPLQRLRSAFGITLRARDWRKSRKTSPTSPGPTGGRLCREDVKEEYVHTHLA